jgi:hypothetical protein
MKERVEWIHSSQVAVEILIANGPFELVLLLRVFVARGNKGSRFCCSKSTALDSEEELARIVTNQGTALRKDKHVTGAGLVPEWNRDGGTNIIVSDA